MPITVCWACGQPAVNVLTREGRPHVNACTGCTKTHYDTFHDDGWTITPAAHLHLAA